MNSQAGRLRHQETKMAPAGAIFFCPDATLTCATCVTIPQALAIPVESQVEKAINPKRGRPQFISGREKAGRPDGLFPAPIEGHKIMRAFLRFLLQSNTVRLGLGTVLGGAAAYLSGQMDAGSAGVLVLTGLLQLLQRGVKLGKEGQAPPALPGN